MLIGSKEFNKIRREAEKAGFPEDLAFLYAFWADLGMLNNQTLNPDNFWLFLNPQGSLLGWEFWDAVYQDFKHHYWKYVDLSFERKQNA